MSLLYFITCAFYIFALAICISDAAQSHPELSRDRLNRSQVPSRAPHRLTSANSSGLRAVFPRCQAGFSP